MEDIELLIEKISQDNNCEVGRRAKPITWQSNYVLPADLYYYLINYEYIKLFINSEYYFEIVGKEEFSRANPIIIGEDAEDDRSYNWFIIATNRQEQYITIDLYEKRLGKCYDSFWDNYGLVGEQPVIANSFTELVMRLFNNRGDYYYWLKNDFDSLGDAYDE